MCKGWVQLTGPISNNEERRWKFPCSSCSMTARRTELAKGVYWLAAAWEAELGTIACEVRSKSLQDAILYSVGANAAHGLRRSDADNMPKKRGALLNFGRTLYAGRPRLQGIVGRVSRSFCKEADVGFCVSSTSTNSACAEITACGGGLLWGCPCASA